MESAPSPPPARPTLPSPSHVSGRTLSFLNHRFKAQQDLSLAPSLVSELRNDRSDLHRTLDDLIDKLSLAASDCISRSNDVRSTMLDHLDSCCPSSPGSDGNGMMGHRQNWILGVELPLLAKEVARIDTVRLYAETTLKLEVLVGDLEDATFSIMNQTSRNNLFNLSKASSPTDIGQEQAKLAVKAMNQIEEILVVVANSRPHWSRLLLAVDSRVEKALAILRAQVLSNHRILLASLGWPPSLSTSNIRNGKPLGIPNPLVLMQGEKKEKYSQSFLELCALQHLHVRRSARLHDLLIYQNEYKLSDSSDINKQLHFEHGLWSIDELVKPIASRMEYHFSQWSDEPKFIFALLYKITRDFLDGVDNILQPLIDKAALVGCSAKEAWVSAMLKMLCRYLERQVFPYLAMNYDVREKNKVISSSWLHLVDLMISFDKKLQVLATSGTPLMGPFPYFEGLPQSHRLFSLFDEHPDWLQIWAEVEHDDAQQKLSLELGDEKSWLVGIRQQAGLTHDEADTFLLSTREDYKAPLIADSVVGISWAMIERGQSLPSKSLRIQFTRSSAMLFLNHFFIVLLQRSQDMDYVTAILEDNDLLTVIGAINTARYFESVLREWNEDISLLEMAVSDPHHNSLFFNDEIMFLVKLETDCLVDIVSALLLQFDALSLDYIHDSEQWAREQTKSEDQILEDEHISISPGFVEALDMLRDRLGILRLNLNSMDFLDLWRSTAGGLDHFILSGIPLTNVKFSRHGVDQFKADIGALLLVFKPFCSRPEAFFPCTSDSVKLLTMDRKYVDRLLKILSVGERSEECLRARGLSHVSVTQAENILRKRKF